MKRAFYISIIVLFLACAALALDPTWIEVWAMNAGESAAQREIPFAKPPVGWDAQPQYGPAPNILDWDLGATFDNLKYQGIFYLAQQLWQPHALLLSISYILHRVGDILSGGILPILLQVLINQIRSSGIIPIVAQIAILLVGVSLIFSFLDLRIVDFKQIVKYSILASLILSQGPVVMARIEESRKQVARTLYQSTFNQVQGSGQMNGLLSGVPGPESWAHFSLSDYYETGITAQDAALSVMGASEGEQMRSSIPSGIANQFFPHPSITHLNEAERNSVLQSASHGVSRIVLGYPLSVIAVLEGLMELFFSIAGFFLLISLPLALVFGFFVPTESILMQILRQYLNLLLFYLVVNALIAVGISALAVAAVSGSVTYAAAASVFAGIFYLFGLSLAKQAAKSSLTALSSSVSQTMGFRDPMQQTMGIAKQAGGLAVGAAGAGLVAAAGLPMLAPSLLGAGMRAGQSDQGAPLPGGNPLQDPGPRGLLPPPGGQGSGARDWARVGLGYVGGRMLQGSPLANLAGGVGVLRTISQSGDGKLGEVVQNLDGLDSMAIGLTAGKSPFAALIQAERAVSRNRRWSGSGAPTRGHSGGAPGAGAPPGSGEGSDNPPLPQRPHYHSEASPWRGDIDAAIRQYGGDWADQVAQAIVTAIQSMQASGASQAEIVRQFVDDEGHPSLVSPGGHTVFDNLPANQRESLREESARRGVSGIIGEALMPKESFTRADLQQAIAAGAAQGIDGVARQLGTNAVGLGSAYGMIATTIKAGQGMSAEEISSAFAGQTGTSQAADLQRFGSMLPEQITVIQTQAQAQAPQPQEES